MTKLAAPLTAFFVLTAACVNAAISSERSLSLDFTQPTVINSQAVWTARLDAVLTDQGLGFDISTNSSIHVSVETADMVAIGWAWRPARSVHVSVMAEFSLGSALSSDYARFVYASYSPDGSNWSTWTLLQATEPNDRKPQIAKFSGWLRVPAKVQKPYQDLLDRYMHMDVSWKSDEEAAVRWILDRDSRFFEQSLPFIGYVKFLFETTLRGGQSLKALDFNLEYMVGGGVSPPRDGSVESRILRDEPWRFSIK